MTTNNENNAAINGSISSDNKCALVDPTSIQREYDTIIADTTDQFLRALASIDPASPLHTPANIRKYLMQKILIEFDIENSVRPKDERMSKPRRLPHDAIIKLILALHPIAKVNLGGEGSVLMMYQEEGINKGLYVEDKSVLLNLIDSYAPGMSLREAKDILTRLANKAPVRRRNEDPDLIPVNNGIFNYKTKQMIPFSPDLIFTAKCCVDYIPNAIIPRITNPDGTIWDIESWMNSLSDDYEVVNLLWQIIGAAVRSRVGWDKVVALFNTVGKNGKSTLCRLIRNLCGEGNFAPLTLAQFAKEFFLGPLVTKSVIIGDDNDPKSFMSDVEAFKSAVRGEGIAINRKGKDPISVDFKGIIIQNFNALPKLNDNTDAIYERFLFVPFSHSFAGSVERSYIKSDYIWRKEVLEYVLWRVLNMPSYYKLSEPAACKAVLSEFKLNNDPVRQFWCDFKDEFVWNLLPYQFLYDLFREWSKKNNPEGRMRGRTGFIHDLQIILRNDPEWDAIGTNQKVPCNNRMDAPEPLIIEYNLYGWRNPVYSGHDPDKIAKPALRDRYNGGVVRTVATMTTTQVSCNRTG